MWVTQTYLGVVEPDADVFVYYLYLDYQDAQVDFTKRLQRALEDLGDVFGDKASLLMPNPSYSGRIEAEVREIRPLWEAVYSKLPGLLLSSVPLAGLTAYDENCVFVPFENLEVAGVVAATERIKRLADRTIAWKHKPSPAPMPPSLGQRLIDSLELKPGVFGFRIDLRKLFEGR